jgi:hypothetical protein
MMNNNSLWLAGEECKDSTTALLTPDIDALA